MFEESPSMDKKSNNAGRFGPGPSSKAQGSESKAKQDVASNKYLRNGRRRENPCPRPEPARKPNPQHFKGVDKRPKPRGSFYNERDRSDVAEESRAEVGSALQKGSKKLNLNHLLNFTYAPRESSLQTSRVSHWDSSWKNRNRLWATKKHKYNKEQFLQANCQFIVRAGGNYAIHSVDPDLLVDWDAIELVRLPSHEIPSCPICLYQPVASKITRCGHVYCWACILHYLALSDKTWRKCPICFEAVHKKDLKSVVPLSTRAYNIGEEITMRLMRREKGSVFAMAKIHWKDRKGELLRLDDATEDKRFSKLLTASPEQVRELVINKERIALEVALDVDKDCPEACFIEAALQLLKDREQSLVKDQTTISLVKELEHLTVASDDSPQHIEADHPTILPAGRRRITYSSAFSDEEAPDEETPDQSEDKAADVLCGDCVDKSNSSESVKSDATPTTNTPRQRYESTSTESIEEEASAEDLDIADVSGGTTGPTDTSKGNYYFYQADDGQHIYLHALNVHMLVKEYGSLDRCPDTIQGIIVEKEGLGMAEDIRRRLRYLCHLPLTCDFEVVEMILKPPVVSRSTVESFAEEIDKRRRRRNKKARDERRRDRHIQEQENQKWGRFPTARLNLDSRYQFPDYRGGLKSEPLAIPLPSPATETPTSCSPASSVTPGDPVPSLSPTGSLEGTGSSVPSFAQMLRTGKTRAAEWPIKPNVHPNAEGLSKSQNLPRSGGKSDSEPEDYVPVPEYHLSFGDAIQAALTKATHVESDSGEKLGKKKKKGKQKTLLFTTSMARNK